MSPDGMIDGFWNAVRNIVTFGANANRTARKEIIGNVGSLADQLETSIVMVTSYLQNARTIDSPKELASYLLAARSKLLQTYHEFRICQGLYEMRDRLQQLFDPARYSIRIGKMTHITKLIDALATGERGILDELSGLFDKVESVAKRLDAVSSDGKKALRERAALFETIENQVTELNRLKERVRTTQRRIVDNL
jgi:ElaB/YqjD/DUF883 family membrane-anchored ribosome-binding protein